MKISLYLAALLCGVCAFAADGVRYKDRLFETSLPTTVTVAENVPFLDKSYYSELTSLMDMFGVRPMFYMYSEEGVSYKSLEMDIYEPEDDDAENRAMVLVCHGGAFVAGTKTSFDQKAVAYVDSLAARGFVTASLEYRLGVLMSSKLQTFVIDSVDFARTVYKSAQDVNAAIRYLRANAKALRIDTNKIYILGNSAGGLLGLENIYALDEKDFPSYLYEGAQYIKTFSDEQSKYVYDTIPLGGLDRYGPKGVGGVANGVVSLWGAIHDASLLKNSKVPVFLAHGDSDYVIPYKVGYAMTEADKMIRDNVPSKYSSVVNVMHFDVHTPTLYGSYYIDSVLTKNKVYHEFYNPVGYGLKHEFYDATRTGEDGNKIIFADSVKNKAFDFLYRLAIGEISETSELAIPRPAIAKAKSSKIAMGDGNLSFTVVRGKSVAYAMFDLKGKRVLSGRAYLGETVMLSRANNGVYYLRVQGETPRRIVIRK